MAGCGPAHEALHISQSLDARVTGIDIERKWDDCPPTEPGRFELLEGSVLDLPFAGETFDFVFYHHVIEHVSDPALSLDEIARVLAPGGLVYIGTPNRHRMAGYVGSQGVSTRKKIEWNLSEYKARIRGRFRNEFGEHAGFSEKELRRLMSRRFVDIEFLTADYLHFKYGAKLPRWVLSALCVKPFVDITAPAVYAVGRKPTQQLSS